MQRQRMMSSVWLLRRRHQCPGHSFDPRPRRSSHSSSVSLARTFTQDSRRRKHLEKLVVGPGTLVYEQHPCKLRIAYEVANR